MGSAGIVREEMFSISLPNLPDILSREKKSPTEIEWMGLDEEFSLMGFVTGEAVAEIQEIMRSRMNPVKTLHPFTFMIHKKT